MALNKDAVRDLYRERAGNYDITANLYYLIGFREAKYRKIAISELCLKPGDTAVEIGCGTGLNFQYILQSIGKAGQLVGVDLLQMRCWEKPNPELRKMVGKIFGWFRTMRPNILFHPM